MVFQFYEKFDVISDWIRDFTGIFVNGKIIENNIRLGANINFWTKKGYESEALSGYTRSCKLGSYSPQNKNY